MSEITVKGFKITIKDEYYSLTDIAKNLTDRRPTEVIRDWLKNQSTLAYLQAWEETYNIKGVQMHMFSIEDLSNDRGITVKKYVERGGTGIISKAGRTGGTYAHITITLNFVNWLKPKFAVWFFAEWVKMYEQKLRLDSNEWMLDKIISNNIESANLAESLKHLNEHNKKI